MVALLAGCACTTEDCANAIHFRPQVDLERNVAYDVEACLDGDCNRATLNVDGPLTQTGAMGGSLTLWEDDDRVELAVDNGDFSGMHDVSFSIRDASGTVIAEFNDSIELTRSEPTAAGPAGPHAGRPRLTPKRRRDRVAPMRPPSWLEASGRGAPSLPE